MSQAEFIVPHCAEQVKVLHCDDDLLLVDKPAGLLSVPGRHPSNRDCLITRIQQDYPSAKIVHRLDMATSGLMIIARHDDSHKLLSKLFQQRKIAKEYLADVDGIVAARNGCIDLPLACDWPNRPRQEINFDYGKHAVTFFERLSEHRENNHCRLLLKPETGRSHQLRVHTASIGHPILGCEFYAHDAARKQSPRLLLHASRLRFAHPCQDTQIDISSPAPF